VRVTSTYTVAVAVVSRSIDPDTIECLLCVNRQTRPPDEVILVTPDQQTSLPPALSHVRVIYEEGNRSHARNVAWRASNSAIVCFWESDSTFNESWIEEVLREFDRGADAVIDRRAVFNPQTYIQRCWDKQFDIRYVDYSPFSAWAFRRGVLESADGFDEALEYAEDTDLGLRLMQRGFKIHLARGAIQLHKGEPRTLGGIIARRFRFGYNKSRGFYVKHPDLFPLKKILLVWTGTLVVAVLAIYGRLLVSAFLILMAYVAICAETYREGKRSSVTSKMILGIAVIRALGTVAYHMGASVGALTRHTGGDSNR